MTTPERSARRVYTDFAGVWLGLGLLAITLVVFGPLRTHDFIDYDDPIYINHNAHVLGGITWDGLRWAFTSGYAENWHPLTWLSHMLDIDLFGLQPGYHHLTNLVLHAASTLLLFVALHKMTGALHRSAIVAALFAIHPLHVESVAWISERKDVLSTTFFMLTLLAYAGYARNRTWSRYALVVAAFAFGLMSKPMLVTLPFVLLLLDYWPLRRALHDVRHQSSSATALRSPSVRLSTLVLEKAPLFVLAAAASVITFVVQHRGGAVRDLTRFPIAHRLANVPLAYAEYVGKMVQPTHLGVFYPYPRTFAPLAVFAAAIALLVVSIVVVRFAQPYPYLPVGWFWFLGMLVPVIGLVQVGDQAMADRYTYVPMVGLFIIVVWGAGDLAARVRRNREAATIATIALVALAVTSRIQVGYWENSLSLWRHTLAVTDPNARAHTNIANAIGGRGDIKGAISEYEKALQLDSTLTEAHNNIAWYLDKDGRTDDAFSHYAEATRLNPRFTDARNNFGVALANHGRIDDAIRELSKSLEAQPDQADTHYNLALVLWKKGLADEAVRHLRSALELDPGHANARRVLTQMQGTRN